MLLKRSSDFTLVNNRPGFTWRHIVKENKRWLGERHYLSDSSSSISCCAEFLKAPLASYINFAIARVGHVGQRLAEVIGSSCPSLIRSPFTKSSYSPPHPPPPLKKKERKKERKKRRKEF